MITVQEPGLTHALELVTTLLLLVVGTLALDLLLKLGDVTASAVSSFASQFTVTKNLRVSQNLKSFFERYATQNIFFGQLNLKSKFVSECKFYPY